MQRTLKTLAVIVALTATSADAGFISWDQFTFPTTGNGSGVLFTTGTYEAAWNAGVDLPPVTVDGIEFTEDGIAGPNLVSISRGASASGNAAGNTWTGNFNVIMNTLATDSSNPREFTITLNGLTINQQYRVQILSYQNTTADRSMLIHYGSDNTGQSTGVFNPGNQGVAGYSNTALFQADATSQDFYFTGNDPNGNTPFLNAMTVFAVPEPSSFIFLGSVGMVTSVWWLRNARRRSAISESKKRSSRVAGGALNA